MRVSVNRQKFHDAMSLVTPWVAKRHEIKCYIKMVVSGSRLSLIAGDFETSVVVELECSPDRDGMALLPQRVYSIVSESSDESMTIEQADDIVKISGFRSEYNLPSADPNKFPSPKLWEGDSYHEIPSKMFIEMVNRTAYATDPDSTRFALGGVLLEMPDETITAIATDGRRLSAQSGVGKQVGRHATTGACCIVLTRPLHSIARVAAGQESVQVQYRGNELFMRTGNFQACTRLIEGRFPNWRTVIPIWADKFSVTISAGVLGSVIRQAAITADTESRGLEFEFTGKMLTIGAKAELGASRVELPIECAGVGTIPVTVRLDHKYMTDILKPLDPSQNVCIEFVSRTSSVLLKTDDGLSAVVMPMAN